MVWYGMVWYGCQMIYDSTELDLAVGNNAVATLVEHKIK